MTTKEAQPRHPLQPHDISRFIAAVNAAAMSRLDSLLHQWLPGGRREGREYVALNPTRADRSPGSFKINIARGVWADFATDDAGSDPVSLYAYLNGIGQLAAAKRLARELGVRP
ncbi:hypothetical protein [Palleronia abyssalis]|uniref:DNA primase n=1 Tax=Palleronia abyssalis TaxID=1501240 RepID=A0A2R8BZ94_9RHOB|nr:hypothetical protein [Palleronia abyssalis]SPJ25450.1 hypothetical protein PAA8504_03301 [Palleronia abyssalis]